MAQTNETARATVYLDGKQAETALSALSKEAENFQKQMKQALAEGDMKKFQTAEKNLKSTQKAMGGLRKEMFSVDKVMKNLSGSTLTDLEKALQKTRSEMRRMSRTDTKWDEKRKQAQLLKKEITNVRTEMGRMQSPGQKVLNTVKGWLPAFGAAAIIGGLKSIGAELFSLTKQMQGDAVRSATVFGNQLGYVEQEAAKVAKQMGLTNREFVANAAATADLLIPLEFTREESAKMSVELQRLTGALDEWTGGSLGAAEVSNILTKAMLGENEQLKQLGIAIRKDSDEFRDLVKVKMEAGNVTKAQAEAMATLELITQKSADAQAAYNREGNDLLRLQKRVRVWWQNMKEGVVEYFSQKPIDKLIAEQTQVNVLADKIFRANTRQEDRIKLIEKLKLLYPKYLEDVDAETVSNEELSLKLKEVNTQLANNIVLLKENEKVKKQQEKADKATRNAESAKANRQGILARLAIDLNLQEETRGKTLAEQTRIIREHVAANKEQIDNMEVVSQGLAYLDDYTKKYIDTSKEAVEQESKLLSVQEQRAALLAQLGISDEPVVVEDNGEGGKGKPTRTETSFKINQDKTTGQFAWEKDDDEMGMEEGAMSIFNDAMTEEEELAFARRKEVWEDWVQFQQEQYAQMDQTSQEYWQTQQAIADAEEDLRQRTMGTLLDLSNTMAVIAGENSAASKAAFALQKAIAIAQIWQNLPKEMAGIAASASLLPPGVREGYLAKAFTTAKIRAGLNSAAIAATAIKGISGSKREGGYGETGPYDDEPKGIYHANEFIGNADSVRNPSVRAVYDIIDVAQKNGTISTIDLPRAITGQLPGKQQGGYTTEEAAPAPVYNMPTPEAIAVAMANELRRNPLKGVWEWREYTEGKKEMEDLEADAGF